jgi:hypothetical protein
MQEQLLNQKTDIEKHLRESGSPLSAYSFTNIFAWQDFFEFDLRMIGGCLCLFAQNEVGRFLYLPPLGTNVTPEVIDECFHLMEKANRGSGVTRIENVSAKQLYLFPDPKFVHIPKGHEYCYFREDIVSLRGNPYKSKRSSYNHFVSSYEHRYAHYQDDMMGECLELYRRWAKERAKAHSDDIYVHMLEENQKVHETVLRHYRQLGLTGRIVTIDGAIKAYSFGFPVNKDMFCVLFEIADLTAQGLAVYMFREFCRDEAVHKYKFINAMDDFEMANIKRVKMSFHPCALLASYIVTKAK